HISLTQTSHTPPNSSPIPHHAPLPPLPLHSFPTRRSSDLPRRRRCRCARSRAHGRPLAGPASSRALPAGTPCSTGSPLRPRAARSEEHTSELQSRFDLVCRLLLEKKKQTHHDHINHLTRQR